MCRSLLVYDGSHRAFRRLARVVTDRMDGVRPVRWDADPVQAFLEAQFDGRPFVFLVVDEETVHAGDEAIARLLREGGLGARVARLFKRAYPAAAGPFGRVVHGRAPADIHGSFRLDEDARGHLEPLWNC